MRVGICGWHGSPGLFTDLYELTMANGFHVSGTDGLEACFYLAFRDNPFGGGFSVACGLEQAVEYLEHLTFSDEDIAFLAEQTGNDGAPIFDATFLERLRDFEFDCDVDAVPEGTVVFPGEPIVTVTGPIIAAQLVETALLNIINFQTLVATKAARVVHAAAGDPVVEFGLRRAQGPDGGLSASRAAYIGGCTGTSNTLAAREYGIPVAGTHAHSWVMAFGDELEAFEAYADAMPNNCTFLVDTYDTLRGVERAAKVATRLREQGHEMVGIRIDSGDLSWLSIHARAILDEAGFPEAKIVASNELDEYLIESLKDQGAAIDLWGVGTKMVTGYDQPALGGVYKLSAVRRPGGEWEPRLKVSEQTAKITTPGVLGVKRYAHEGAWVGDMIYDVSGPGSDAPVMVDPGDPTRRKSLEGATGDDLLVPIFRAGTRVYDLPALTQVRDRVREQIAQLDPSIVRFLNPHVYPVGLEHGLHDKRLRLIMEARGVDAE